jgi:bacterioferritin
MTFLSETENGGSKVDNHSVAKELNKFLKGMYMGIHAYEHFIEKLEDEGVRAEFQRMQQEHKHNAALIAERTQNLGAVPADDEGIAGSIQGYISSFFLPDSQDAIVDKTLTGEDYYAIQMSEENVRGDLDPESRRLVETVLGTDRKHVEYLNTLKGRV